MIPLFARFSSRNSRQLRFQNNIVNSALLDTKTPIDGMRVMGVSKLIDALDVLDEGRKAKNDVSK